MDRFIVFQMVLREHEAGCRVRSMCLGYQWVVICFRLEKATTPKVI